MIDYQAPSLLFITSTPDGILANVVVGGNLTRIPLTRSHSLALLVQLSHALEFNLAYHRNGQPPADGP
jgi:hypothetical protein